jgi:hypothetical protein
MANLTGAALETKYNDSSTGLFKDNTNKEIVPSRPRSLVTDVKDSFLNRTDDVIDEDNMVSNLATKVPTQQSVKAYVDAVAGGGTVLSVTGTTGRITSTGGTTPVIDISATYDALWAAAIAAAALDSTTPSTAGGTITLDFNSKVERMFVGSASFGTAKAIALSNDGSALVLNMVLTLSNVAAVLTFPSTFTMSTADSRWADAGHTFTAQIVGKYEFSATWDGTDWNLKVAGPYS